MHTHNFLLSLTTAALCVLPVSAQLVTPAGLPATTANFRLRARSTDGSPLGGQIQNWAVKATGDSGCDQGAMLTDSDAAAASFYVHTESAIIESDRDSKHRILTLEEDVHKRMLLKIQCGEASTAQLSIGFNTSVPILVHQGTAHSQLYTCKDDAGAFKVFYREAASNAVPQGCADIELWLECINGVDHGMNELAACCKSVQNGQCLSK